MRAAENLIESSNDSSLDIYIQTSLKKFSITDAAIAEMKRNYSALQIKDADDKKGYLEVRAARMTVKGSRVEVEKKRKELNTDAVKFQKAVNEEAKRITLLLEPIESHLQAQEDFYDSEKERIKQEKEKEEQARLQERISRLIKIGFNFDGAYYVSDLKTVEGANIKVSPTKLKLMTDVEFDHAFQFIKKSYDEKLKALAEIERQRQEQIAREEQKRKEEAALLEKQRQEQEEEKRRLAAIAKEQEEKEALLRAEQEEILKQKLALEEQKRQETLRAVEAEKKLEVINLETQKKPSSYNNEETTLDKEQTQYIAKIAEEKKSSYCKSTTLENILNIVNDFFNKNESVYLMQSGNSILMSANFTDADREWIEKNKAA